jgi:predicted short-subunit dehydrogenase-like oxidoreductase (DUF2520 family)
MARRRDPLGPVFVHGAGKVGAGLARALRRAGVDVTLRAARKGLPRAVRARVVILAVRDRDLEALAARLRDSGALSPDAVVVHVSGALGPEPLAALRGSCAGVAQMHPMMSFASPRSTPGLARGNVRVAGDPRAVARATALARTLGMTPRPLAGLDPVAYHAAAGLVANGAAALGAIGAELLERGGVPAALAPKMLGPLLRSVADNIEALGFPGALTGPVRRGDAAGVAKHLAVLGAKLPGAVPLYLAAATAQLPLARALRDAPAGSFDEVERVLQRQRQTL